MHTTSIPARSDGITDPVADSRQHISTSRIQALGTAVALGAVSWALGLFAMGTLPTEHNAVIWNLTALAFQLGLLALLQVQLRTGAVGTGRFARRFFAVEHVLLIGAMGSTVVGFWGANTSAVAGVLDICWPLSMLGMFAVGVRVAVAGRWRGAARFWPLVAESWAVVTVPIDKALGDHAGGIVGGAHLLLGYAALGVILALRPELTRAEVKRSPQQLPTSRRMTLHRRPTINVIDSAARANVVTTGTQAGGPGGDMLRGTRF